MTTYECKCKHISYNFQKVLDFPLLLPNNIKNLNLKDLLDNYFSSDEVDFESICESCNEITKHKKNIL